MDIQLKRGLLDICVLAAIKNGESYGYQIIKDIKPFLDISESTLHFAPFRGGRATHGALGRA